MWRLALILGLLPLAACTAGPARNQPPPTTRVFAGCQGGGSEVVFHGVAIASADELEGGEVSRRDAALGLRQPATAFEVDSWPAAPAPTLDDARYLHFPRDPRTFIYFNTREPGRHSERDLYFYWRSWE